MRYSVLKVDNFLEAVKAVSVAANNNGYMFRVSDKLKDGSVPCVLTAVTKGVIQATSMFGATIVQVEVAEDGSESKCAELKDFGTTRCLPAKLLNAVTALEQQNSNMLILLKDNEFVLKTPTAVLPLPYIDKLVVDDNPKDLTKIKFDFKKEDLDRVCRQLNIQSSGKDKLDNISFVYGGDKSFNCYVGSGHLIAKKVLPCVPVVKGDATVPEMNAFALPVKKLLQIVNTKGESGKVSFTCFLDQAVVRQVNITYERNVYYMHPTEALAPGYYRMIDTPFELEYSYVTEAEKMLEAFSIISLSEKSEVAVLTPYAGENGAYLSISDLVEKTNIKLPIEEAVNISQESIKSYLSVFSAAVTPFDGEKVKISLTTPLNGAPVGFAIMEAGTLKVLSTQYASAESSEQSEDDSAGEEDSAADTEE